MPIHEAIDYIVNDSRTALRQSPTGYDDELVSKFKWQGEPHQHAIEIVREKVLLGEIRMWGRKQFGHSSAMTFDSALQEIPADYWKSAFFNILFCFYKTEHNQTVLMYGHEGHLYTHITLSRHQVVKAWPRKVIWRRLLWRKKRLSYRAS